MTGDPRPRLAVIPSAPVLIPGATGRTTAPEVEELRDAVRRAIAWLTDEDRVITVVAAGEDQSWSPASLSARELGLHWRGVLGSPAAGGAHARSDYPTAFLVAAAYAGPAASGELLTTSGTAALAAPQHLFATRSLLVVGNGSARRRDGAPGYVDERAVPHDAQTEQALRSGDTDALRRLDVGRATALLDDVCAPLRAVGSHLSAPMDAALDYCSDPFGVAYFVARWQL